MKKEKLSAALGEINETYIEEAIAYQKSRKSILLRRVGALAACFVLMLGIVFSARYVVLLASSPNGFTLLDTTPKKAFSFGSSKPEAPPKYWDDSFYAKVFTKKGTYKPEDSFQLNFELGLTNDKLGAGDLIIEIDSAEFSVESNVGEIQNGKLIIENFTEEAYTKESPLKLALTFTPNFSKDWARGTVKINFCFLFDDAAAFCIEANDHMKRHFTWIEDWQAQFIENGMLTLDSESFGYAMDGIALWIDTYRDMLFECMLMNHYDTWRISGKEFMRIYYEYLYSDNIFASVTAYREEDQTFRFEYISKNIRYEKTEMIHDDEIWALFEEIHTIEYHAPFSERPSELAEKRMKMAHLILSYMYEHGVITEEEYAAESIWLSEASTVGNMQAAYPGKMGNYARKLKRYIYTHQD